jgi:hypothetical protein
MPGDCLLSTVDRSREAHTMGSLNDIMELDHVIHVAEDGTITERAPEGDQSWPYAPELLALSSEDGSHLPDTDPDLQRQAADAGWTLETGWTGQHGYRGPCMHPSEYIGGGIERHIRETPGYWVAVVVEEEDPESSDMWALAFHPDPDDESGCEGRSPVVGWCTHGHVCLL